MPGSTSVADDVLLGKDEVQAAKFKSQINGFRRSGPGAPPTLLCRRSYSFRSYTGFRPKGKGAWKGKGSGFAQPFRGKGFGKASGRGRGRTWGMFSPLEESIIPSIAQGELSRSEGAHRAVSGGQGVPFIRRARCSSLFSQGARKKGLVGPEKSKDSSYDLRRCVPRLALPSAGRQGHSKASGRSKICPGSIGGVYARGPCV